MEQVKWLVVGAGDITRKRAAAALSSASGSGIVAVCSGHEENARSLAGEFGVKEVFPDFETALEGTGADAVYLATPVSLHAEHAVAALEAGKHVLAEKPLALTGDEAQRVVDAAQASGKTAGCAYYRRCFPRYRHATEMIESGEFGKVVLVRMTLFSWFDPAPDDPKFWRVVRKKSGGGALADMGSHKFDLLIGMFGMPRSVYAKCDNLVHDWDVEDSCSVLMTLENGAHVVAAIGWNSKTWRDEFEIVGTEAKVCWLPFDTGPVVKTAGRDIQELDLPNAENVHLPLVEDFVDAVRTGRDPVCPVAEAAKANVLLDAIHTSAQENREVEL